MQPLTEFYKHLNGLASWCKECYRKLNRTEYRKKYNRSWIVKNGYARKGKGKLRKHIKYLVSKAIKNGELKKQPCEECGDMKVQAHHDNYNKPLEVRWLCQKHHIVEHFIIKHKASNAQSEAE